MAKIMTINSGSSSLKFKLYEMPEEKVICSGVAERIGNEDGIFTIKYNGNKDVTTPKFPDHAAAAQTVLDALVEKGIIKDFDEIKGIKLIDYSSQIMSSPLDVKSTTITFISDKVYNSNFLMQIGTVYEEPTSHSSLELRSGLYEHKMTFLRDSYRPVKLAIHSAITDIDAYITKWEIDCDTTNDINVTVDDYIPTPEKSNSKLFNIYYLYEIRGDKAKTSDGIFTSDVLISKVTGVAPKLGYVVRFLTSIPGIIFIIGLALISTLGGYFLNRNKNNKNKEIEKK